MVARVLNGEQPGAMAVETMEKLDLFVNPAAAERMGVTLSDEIIADAEQVIDSAK